MPPLELRRAITAALAAATTLRAGLALAAPAAADETISMQVSGPRQVDQALTVSGQVSGAGSEVTVWLTRQEPSDSSPQLRSMQTTQNGGQFAFTDTPDERGRTTYTVSVQPSGPSLGSTVTIDGLAPNLSVSTDRSTVPSGHRVRLTAHLALGPTNRHVTIYARPYHGSRTQVASGDVDATSGDLRASYLVTRRTTFTVHFGGDSRYDPATATRVVRARAVLIERLRGGYATAGSYRLYHRSDNPRLFVQLRPPLDHACLYFRAQHYYRQRWHTSALSSCVHTNAYGEAVGVLTGQHAAGEPYRLRAEWRGSRVALASNGSWLKVEFRR
jgi:hypothetical protein